MCPLRMHTHTHAHIFELRLLSDKHQGDSRKEWRRPSRLDILEYFFVNFVEFLVFRGIPLTNGETCWGYHVKLLFLFNSDHRWARRQTSGMGSNSRGVGKFSSVFQCSSPIS